MRGCLRGSACAGSVQGSMPGRGDYSLPRTRAQDVAIILTLLPGLSLLLATKILYYKRNIIFIFCDCISLMGVIVFLVSIYYLECLFSLLF